MIDPLPTSSEASILETSDDGLQVFDVEGFWEEYVGELGSDRLWELLVDLREDGQAVAFDGETLVAVSRERIAEQVRAFVLGST